MRYLLSLILCATTINISPCLATKEVMISAAQVYTIKTTPIYNQEKVIKDLKDFVKIPILFPTHFKGTLGQVYFAHVATQKNSDQSPPDRGYFITITYDPDCTAHVCTLGTLQAVNHGTLTPDYTLKFEGEKVTNIEVPKVPVNLENNIKAYYTPGYAGASYTDPKIQWYYKDTLYTIQWRSDNQKDLIQMANSAMSAELHKPHN